MCFFRNCRKQQISVFMIQPLLFFWIPLIQQMSCGTVVHFYVHPLTFVFGLTCQFSPARSNAVTLSGSLKPASIASSSILFPLIGLAVMCVLAASPEITQVPPWTINNRSRSLRFVCLSLNLCLRPLQRPPLGAELPSGLLPGIVSWSRLLCEAQSALQMALARHRLHK